MIDVVLGLALKKAFSGGLVHYLVLLNNAHLDLSDRRLLKVLLLNPQLIFLHEEVVKVHISIKL